MRFKFSVPAVIVSAMALASCSPQIYSLTLDLRVPSVSGIDFLNKDLAIVYEDSPIPSDTIFCNAFASGLASAIEADYYASRQVVDIYCLPIEADIDRTSRQSMVDMVMKYDADAVIFLTHPLSAEGKLTENILIYDAMDSEEKIKHVKKLGVSIDMESDSAGFVNNAIRLGKDTGLAFAPSWKSQNIFLYYYEGYGWYEGLDDVDRGDFASAIGKWMTLATKGSVDMRSRAAYNVGIGCFLMGNTPLALEWLDKSDEISPTELTSTARQMISNYSSR